MNRIRKSAIWKSPAKVSIVLFVLLEILTMCIQPNLLTMNWINLKSEAAITLILASIGETFVLLVGGIDLSIAGIISIVNCFAVVCMRDNPASIIVVSLASLGIGLGIGLINGFIIQRFSVQPFIVTFSTWYICGGIAYLILPKDGGTPPDDFANALMYRIGDQFSITLIIIVVLLILWAWFRRTQLGISLYAVGNNALNASLNGINVKRVNIFAYGASGFFAALCGLFRVAVVATGSPTGGESYFNQAIAAVVIGGTLLSGGIGGQYGTIIGVLAFNAIADLLVFAGASSYWSTLLSGILLIVSVLISTITEIIHERRELTTK
jgi:ribose transport system permease protein